MAVQAACPNPETLDDLLANRLPADLAASVRAHVAVCAACGARLERSASETSTTEFRYPFLLPPRAEGEIGWLSTYRIRRLLGQGGMAYVFDAEDTVLHRPVALKVLKPELADAHLRERFRGEAQTLAGLSHEHIVTIYAVSEDNGVVFLAMERLTGESLEDRLARDRWLPVREALALTREAAEGLAVAHAQGLVHRDVKPSNLWLETTPSGQFKRVKLIDFGIARPVQRDSSLTQANAVIGTPAYMSPEQATGLPLDRRTDLYSLGCVLYRLLTGVTPFSGGQNTRSLLEAVGRRAESNLTGLEQRVPRPAAELLSSLLAVNPDARPPTAEVLIERLRRLEQDLSGTQLVAPAAASRLPPWTQRRPGLVGIWLGALAIAAAVVVGAIAAYQAIRPHAAETEEAAGATDAPPLKVGILHSQTGTFSIHERPIIKAAQMAIEEINRAGGVLGRPIKPIGADGESEEKVFGARAKELIEKDGVEVLFGCWTSSSRKRVAEVCAEHNRLLFYPSGSEGLEESPSVVYLGGIPNQTVIPLVEWASSKLRKRRFFLVGSEYVYSHAVNAILEHELKDLGATVVGTHYALLGETDFKAVVQQIKEQTEQQKERDASMILCSIDGQSNVAFFQTLRSAGVRPETVPTVWFNIAESELSLFRTNDMKGDYSVGCYFGTITTPGNKEFLERFRRAYGADERVNDAMQTAYFGVYLWKKAVEKAKSTDAARVRAALRGLSVEAPEGPIRMDARTQYAYRTALIGQIAVRDNRSEFRIVGASPGPVEPEPYPRWRTPTEWQAFLHGLYVQWDHHWEKHK